MNPSIRQSQRSQNQFNDEKEHYKSLRTLFITAMSIFSAFVTGILSVFLWSTFQSRKEMKDELDGTQKEMKQAMKDMKDEVKDKGEEFKSKETQWSLEIKDLKTSSKAEIEELKSNAVLEISSLKGVAKSEARSRIDEVFKETNLKEFIETVAKNEMSDFVISKVKEEAVLAEKQKTDEYIHDLESSDLIRMSIALNQLLLNPNISLTEEQISKIIVAAKNSKSDYAFSFFSILYLRQSEQITDFFKEELLHNPQHATFGPGAFLNIMRQDKSLDISFYEQYFERDKNQNNFSLMITTADGINKKLAAQLLNSKPMVDYLWANPENGGFKNLKENLEQSLSKDQENLYKNTYFFTKK